MKILVFDDSKTEQFGATAQLKQHETTVVSTYDEAEKKLLEENWDMFMTDLMVPASAKQLVRGDKQIGKEAPLGIFLLVLALKQGVKKVALITDMNHHKHPASAALDPLVDTPFSVNGTVLISNNPSAMCNEKTGEMVPGNDYLSDEGRKKYQPNGLGTEWVGLRIAKVWSSAVDALNSGTSLIKIILKSKGNGY